MSGFVIAVDGPAASGKGTIAAELGAHFGLPVLDTGLLYRAVGVTLIAEGGDLADEAGAADVARRLDATKLADPAFRTREAGEAASRVAAYPSVRLALRDFQRAFAAQAGGAVIDGRDIGTVIAPDAPAKLYVTASAEVRARRRWLQLKETEVSYEAVLTDILRRDARDAGRADSPMRPADDAVLLDTTEMTIPAAADAARRIVEAARARWEIRR
ncbi:MAG TPA: (d)CMP kinase [Solirubrobacterales bacterium]|nr:(d)CMP kinase [Solirubrobacterales bacterium]